MFLLAICVVLVSGCESTLPSSAVTVSSAERHEFDELFLDLLAELRASHPLDESRPTWGILDLESEETLELRRLMAETSKSVLKSLKWHQVQHVRYPHMASYALVGVTRNIAHVMASSNVDNLIPLERAMSEVRSMAEQYWGPRDLDQAYLDGRSAPALSTSERAFLMSMLYIRFSSLAAIEPDNTIIKAVYDLVLDTVEAMRGGFDPSQILMGQMAFHMNSVLQSLETRFDSIYGARGAVHNRFPQTAITVV